MSEEVCAHLRISWRVEDAGSGSVRGWWVCLGCGAEFVPKAVADNLQNDVEHFESDARRFRFEAENALRDLEEAREDTARLDWLERNLYFNRLKNWCVTGPQWEFIDASKPRMRFETAREAIDKARNGRD